MITIRRATLEDRSEIFKFIQHAYLDRWQYRIPDRWEWEYINNPCLGKGDLPVFIAVEDTGKIVGQTCAMIELVKIGRELYHLGWSVDTYVLPEFRGQKLGSKLQKINDEAHELFMSLSMSGINREIKLKLGSANLDPVPIYRRFQKVTPDIIRNVIMPRGKNNQPFFIRWLSARLRFSFMNRFLALLKNMWDDSWNRKFTQKPDPSLVLTEVDTFPEDVDLLWERLSSKFYAIIKRDRLHLNWKYVEQPHMDYLRVIARRNGEICGYMILRKGKPPEKNFGMISDIFADPDDDRTISTLLSFAVIHFRKEKAAEIIAATTIPEYQCCLIKLGFVKTDEAYPVIHARMNNPAIEMALEPGRWFLGNSDQDWDQYPITR